MAEHEGRIPLFHLDLYRLADAGDAFAGGLLDDRQAAGVTLVEWPERLGSALPAARVDVRIDGTGEARRRIRIEAGDARPGPLRRWRPRPLSLASRWPRDDRERRSRARGSSRSIPATSRIIVAAGAPDGRVLRVLDWPAGHRHGERLLPGVERLLAETGLARADLAGVVVGTGPGAFTGLRVGIATAKALAHAMGVPIAGVGTGVALLRAAAATSLAEIRDLVLLLPAGPHDRVEVRDGEIARLLPGGDRPRARAGRRPRRGGSRGPGA